MTTEIAPLTDNPAWRPAAVEWQKTGLVLAEDFSFEEWQALGKALDAIEDSSAWWFGDWWTQGERRYGEKYAQGLEPGRAYQTRANAASVARRVEFSRRRENLSFAHHQEVAYLEPCDQDLILNQAEEEGWTRQQTRAAVRDYKRAINPPPPLPAGTFDLVYADPPWRYEFVEAENRAIENHYPTMSLDEIKALELPTLAPDALLLLWATPPKLDEALTVMREWGFSYRSCLVWVKHAIGMGYWARQRHELLLVGRLGDFSPPEPSVRPDSVIESPREEHSKKPVEVYELIERMFPDARKIELFCRKGREGWAVWGNQVPA